MGSAARVATMALVVALSGCGALLFETGDDEEDPKPTADPDAAAATDASNADGGATVDAGGDGAADAAPPLGTCASLFADAFDQSAPLVGWTVGALGPQVEPDPNAPTPPNVLRALFQPDARTRSAVTRAVSTQAPKFCFGATFSLFTADEFATQPARVVPFRLEPVTSSIDGVGISLFDGAAYVDQKAQQCNAPADCQRDLVASVSTSTWTNVTFEMEVGETTDTSTIKARVGGTSVTVFAMREDVHALLTSEDLQLVVGIAHSDVRADIRIDDLHVYYSKR